MFITNSAKISSFNMAEFDAVAKYFKRAYQFLIREGKYLLLCLSLALASIDSRENR